MAGRFVNLRRRWRRRGCLSFGSRRWWGKEVRLLQSRFKHWMHLSVLLLILR